MYIMFRSVLFLASFEIAFSSSADLPEICKNANTFPCVEPEKLIPWTECGEYLPACDAKRCCTDKKITTSSSNSIEAVFNDDDIHVDVRTSWNRSMLMFAASNNMTDIVMKLIARGASINLHDYNGETALMFASRAGSANITKMLLDAKASTDIANRNGKNALMLATSGGRIPVIGLLLDFCAEVGKKELDEMNRVKHVDEATWNIWKERLSQAQKNPLIAAVLRESADGLKHILENQDKCMRGKRLDDTDDGGLTAMDHARRRSNPDMVNILNHYAKIGEELLDAARKGSITVGKNLLAQGVNGVVMKNAAIVAAVENNHAPFVDFLLENGASANARNNDGQTALMLAAKKNNTTVKSLLQSPEIEVNAVDNDGRSALMIAALNCRRDNVQSFVDYGKIDVSAIDNNRQTALMLAVRCQVDVVQTLLAHANTEVSARDHKDRTALMRAVDACKAPAVSALLQYGDANLCNMRYMDNETVLMHAVKKCEVDVVNHLVNHSRIQINAERQTATALMIAVEKNRSLDIIISLLSHPNVSVAPTKRKNDSPLVRAVMKNRTDIVESLLLANADPEVEYNETLTVLGIAVQENVNVKIVELLLEYNATVDHKFMQGLSMTDYNSEIVRMIQNARWPLLKIIENPISGLSIENEMTSMRHRKRMMKLDECMGFFEPKTMWMTAAQANNTDAMEQLLRLDTKHRYIDRTCNTGDTPLCIAATENHVDVAKLLLNECPNLDLRCDKRNYDLGISFNKINTYGKSALEIAKEKGFSDIAEEIRYKKWILLGKIARNESKSVEELRKEYMEGGHKCDITIAMRSYVINPNAENDLGETAVDWAIRFGQENILSEISAVFPSETLVGLCSRNVTRYGQKIVRILQCPNTFNFKNFGFFAFLIIPLCALLYPIIDG